ncbi:C2H2 transcription factor (AmdA) [Paracoccidioides lutzii Pb01]|uniref:C2H2 transcription factor (AmdA) n=1 Tax=Paracoccidioides lutzii (strain ATCC MYA-826 / Pb01) TaxID=502779 RepID=C1HBX2_PARBA|nr:C2H2 transcription factor (AmdA) [Paracoccidioides lutzii Pb01]EEH38536.2 C2H2 transcription factor (AmdA) [Paracoccidioides lutzii Pb01]
MVDSPVASWEVPQEEKTPRDTGTKPKRFQCMRCQTRFARLEHLQRHERIHTQEKPFCCQLCDHRFTRSDLLIRHQRLSHNKDGSRKKNPHTPKTRKSAARKLNASHSTPAPYLSPSPIVEPPLSVEDGDVRTHPAGDVHPPISMQAIIDAGKHSLATLTMAAEHVALEMPDQIADTNTQTNRCFHSITVPENAKSSNNFRKEPVSKPPEQSVVIDSCGVNVDFETSLAELALVLNNGVLSSHHFEAIVRMEQPTLFFAPEFSDHPGKLGAGLPRQAAAHYKQNSDQTNKTCPASWFRPWLPSPLPKERSSKRQTGHTIPSKTPLPEISPDAMRDIQSRLSEFFSVIPAGFQLPSRLALSRYVAGYINGFHEHFPFLHVPTMSVSSCSVELILAMAALGTQYCFEDEKAIELFYASKRIGMERIRRREAKLAALNRHSKSELASSAHVMDDASTSHGSYRSQSMPGPSILLPKSQPSPLVAPDREDLIQTTQALLILMAIATWAKHKEIVREALALQSMLSTLVRDDGLRSHPVPDDISWDEWIQIETRKRTKFAVYCFFNLHCIVYNIPSLILNSELNLQLPCSAVEFNASNRLKWLEARGNAGGPQIDFQTAVSRLFSHGGHDIMEHNSSLGNYILIHAIIQHIYFLRQFYGGRFDGNHDVAPDDLVTTENALRNWQTGWKCNVESHLDPQDANGPTAFNSTALLQLAYIRLIVDTGPGRALDTRDPVQIARAFAASPRIKRTPNLIRAVLHSVHNLSIPVKVGIRLMSSTQSFIWSIQHSLCSLECACLLSKWLEALLLPHPDPPVTEDEWRIAALVKMMLDETEFAPVENKSFNSAVMIKQINSGVLRVWAKIFGGAQTWAIVDVIGSSLNVYADMIDADC